MFIASVISHPPVTAESYGDTAHVALRNLFESLKEFCPVQALQCQEFWCEYNVAQDMALLNYVEGYCGAFAFKCEEIKNA